MSQDLRKVPVNFEKINEYSIGDTRFITVKIWLMHLGLNLNNSIFLKDVVEKAIPSLSNTPILAYIEDNDNDDLDFSDHRIELIQEDGDIKAKYKGSAYGVIPESNEASFETKICDDGIEREFLTCKGLLWTKFDDAADILNRDIYKDESMELAESYSGSFNTKGNFVFDKFLFDGACFLGNGVEPAMTGACIEINFSLEEIQRKLAQFQAYTKSKSDKQIIDFGKGKHQMLNSEKISSILAEYELTADVIEFKIAEDTDEASLREMAKDFVGKKKANYTGQKSIKNPIEVHKTDSNPTVAETFSYTYGQLREDLQSALESLNVTGNNVSCKKYHYLIDFDESYVYVCVDVIPQDGSYTSEYYRISYTKKENDIILSTEFEKIIYMWLTDKEQLKIENDRIESSAELETLRQFKSSILAKQRQDEVSAVFDRFDAKLSEYQAYMDLKENTADLSVETIEEKCFALVGKIEAKFSTSKKNKDSVVKLDFEKHEDKLDDGYGGILAARYSN